MTVRLSFADWLVIIAYFVAVVFVGFRAARKAHGHIDDYLVAGSGLTLTVFIATLVSTWYGGILGVGEFSYRYGISNWFIFGVPYYFFAILFAIFLAPRVRQAKLHTIPDKLRESYGGATAAMGSFLTLFIVTPAPYVLMVGIILEMISGWSLTVSVIVTTVASIIYLYSGGLHSDVRTNTVEFVLMYIGFGVILPFCFTHYGGLSFIRTHVPPGHLTVTGGNSWQYIIAWFFIASWTLIDPAFHQRCYAAKSGSVARYGILLSVIFWLFFDFMTSMTGLYARAIVPNLNQPAMSYPALAEVVRQVENEVRQLLGKSKTNFSRSGNGRISGRNNADNNSVLSDIIDKLRKRLGTQDKINYSDSHKGEIKIEFYNDDDMGRLIELLLGDRRK